MREKDIKQPKSAAGIRAIPIPSITAVYLRFKAFSAVANIPTLKGIERGYGSFIAHLEALENGLSLRKRIYHQKNHQTALKARKSPSGEGLGSVD